jgi:hypothetical protein
VRQLASADRVLALMQALGGSGAQGRVYLAGGATAVLFGWRASTLDVDLRPVPDNDQLLRAIPQIKEQLQVNVELAWPGDFIPLPNGWQDRSIFIRREGRLDFYHLDPYSQALAKLERGHRRDEEDVRSMLTDGLIETAGLEQRLTEIESELYRFPAIDPASFRRRVEALRETPTEEA